MTPPTSQELRQLRAQAHSLKPIVTVAWKGLAPSVLEEVDRALTDHELIKVKIAVSDREQRSFVIGELCTHSEAYLVQRVGNVATLLRPNPQADPQKSNLHRSR